MTSSDISTNSEASAVGIATATSTPQETGQHDESSTSGLFAGYKRRRIESDQSVAAQLNTYVTLCDDSANCDVLSFWSVNRSRLYRLFTLAMRCLAVPASSAPVERVFSHGGIIMRPHRARLSHKMLSNLIFLKCNNLDKYKQ